MPGEYSVIRPGKPELKTTFLYNAGIGKMGETPPDFRAVVANCLKWVQEKHHQELPQGAWNLEPFRVDETNATILAVTLEEEYWALRLRQPDIPFKNRRAIAGRSWTTDISLERKADGEICFFIRVICSSQAFDNPPVAYSRPLVLKSLADEFGLYKEQQLLSEPLALDGIQDLSDLMHYLLEPSRRTPVVVLSEMDRKDPFHASHPYGLDELDLAQRLTGLAHVYCIPWKLAFHWSELVGKEWSVYDGGVRCYYPLLNFDTQDPYQHPLTYKSRVRYWQHGQEEGPIAFSRFLTQKLAEETTRHPEEISDAIFYAELQPMVARRRLETSGSPNVISETLSKPPDDSGQFHLDWESLAEEYARDFDLAKQECRHYKEEIRKLKLQNQSLLASLKAVSAAGVVAESMPERYEEVSEWVEQEFAGRLLLVPRAKRALKDADYDNLGLVLQCLRLLANEYIEMKQGCLPKPEFDALLGSLNVELQRSLADERVGEFASQYFVEYPPGSGRKERLDWHLSSGNSRESRYCLRIYFFYDEEMERVVVGWLPSHLDNRLT